MTKYKLNQRLYQAIESNDIIIIREYEVIHVGKRYKLYPHWYNRNGNITFVDSDLDVLHASAEQSLAAFKQGLVKKIESARKSLEAAIDYESLMRDADVKHITVELALQKDIEAAKALEEWSKKDS